MTSFHLLTYFGTLIYLDETSSMLRHGPIGHVPENLIARCNGAMVSLHRKGVEGIDPVGDLGPGGCRFQPGDPAPCVLELRRNGADHVTLHWTGRVLTAEEDGHVSLFRSMIGLWEVFLLLSDDELEDLKFVLQNSWAQRTPSRVFAPHEVELEPDFVVSFGEHCVELGQWLPWIRGPMAQRPSLTLEIVARVSDWKIIFLRLYRPLIYLVAYGNGDIFGCASLAIQSVRAFGNVDAEIMLITDRTHLDIEGLGIAVGIRTVAMQAYDLLDFALARYKLADIAPARQYQPVIYLDTDVVCNAPLGGLLLDLCFSDALYALPEGDILTEADFYGRTLFTADPGVAAETDPGISSGILAFRNVSCVERVFGLIADCAYGFARRAMRRDFFPAFDQPFANYVIYKGPVVWKSLGNWAVGSSHVVEPDSAPEGRRGLIHFAGGVGNASPKIVRMRQYLAELSE